VSLPAHPLALVIVSARPRVHTLHLKAVRPLARVLALTFGPRAHAVAVSFPVFPVAAIRASIVKVESTAARNWGRGWRVGDR